MKKLLILTAITMVVLNLNLSTVKAEEMVKIEIPASEIENIDIKYENESKSEKALNSIENATDKTVSATKKATKIFSSWKCLPNIQSVNFNINKLINK